MRLLTAPLKFVWGMLMWAVFLLLSPLLLVGVLVFGIHFMSRDEIDLVKILLVVLGPFAFDFWWITIEHFSGRYRAQRLIAQRSETGDEYTEADLSSCKAWTSRITSAISLCSSFRLSGRFTAAHLFYGAGDQLFFVGVLAGILSPVIIIAAYKVVRRSFI